MNFVLLLGAGFSRNWGGFLASDAYEFLLGCPGVDASLRGMLIDDKDKGGFERTLGRLQQAQLLSSVPLPELLALYRAILRMFQAMDDAFSGIPFEPQNDVKYLVRSFLVRFDAIFTLNQDLLLERHYLNDNVSLAAGNRWNGYSVPGMRAEGEVNAWESPLVRIHRPDPSLLSIPDRFQPYIKLHGSINWRGSGAEDLLILGANKPELIEKSPVLKWYHAQFRSYLARPGTRLMTIGYGYADDHINAALVEESMRATDPIEIYVVDPLGIDVIDKNRGAAIPAPGTLATQLWPRVVGSSKRSLRDTFNTDRYEHGKLLQFFGTTPR